jgi:hypothetical protein
MYTLMHISDLHRSKLNPVTNDELISCLTSDRLRYRTEPYPISLPNAIIVSGDLVAGLPLRSADYPEALKQQYIKALDFLVRLTNAFADGNRSRVIIAPGNHDVDWNMAATSMSFATEEQGGVQGLLSQPNTIYRWSWSDLKLLRITNYERYKERFKYFCDLYDEFYEGARLAFAVDPKRDWNNFELDDGRILVTAFNSCIESDCFNNLAHIPSQAVAQSHLETLGQGYSLKIAVWHHDVKGDPRRSDYLDSGIVLNMIDKGYRLGMHGHRHKADASPIRFYLSAGKHVMCVAGTGSLCSDYRELPAGVSRQYNLVELDSSYCKARIHVREMRIEGVFGPGRLIELDGGSYTDVEWTQAPQDTLVNTGRNGGSKVQLAQTVETLIANGKYDDVIPYLKRGTAKGQLGSYGRRLLLEALSRGKHWRLLVQEIGEPKNSDELTKVVIALIALSEWAEGEQLLKNAEASGKFPAILLEELRSRLRAEKRMHSERT